MYVCVCVCVALLLTYTLSYLLSLSDSLYIQGKVKEKAMLGGVGALVGERFWCKNKNAAMHYSLLGTVTD
jgi:hypothetical protein